MSDYIRWIRSKVGHDNIILNFAGACITNEKNEILLQKRSQTENVWGLPGGAVEWGELIEETAVREIKEETGLDIKVEYLMGVYSKYFTEYSNGDKAQSICHCFKAAVVNGSLQMDNKETFDLRFYDKDHIPPLFVQQHADIISDLFENRAGVFR